MSEAGEETRRERARETRQHLGHLDALRGIAVLGVILIHSGQWCPSRFSAFAMLGQRGVQLFFTVSAFTLMLSGDNRKAEPHGTLAFFLRRFFRLAPLYYPCILVSRWFTPLFRFGWGPTLLSVAFLHNLSPKYYWAGTFGGWSLSDEALFYMLLPGLYRSVRNLRSAIYAFAISVVISFTFSRILLTLYPKNEDYWLFYCFITEAPIFLMGIVVYFLWKEHLRSLQGLPLARNLSMLFLLLTAAIAAMSLPFYEGNLLESSVGCATLLVAVSLHPWKLLVNRVTIFLGKISYSMYLTQFFVLWVFVPWLRRPHAWLAPHATHDTLNFLITFVVVTLAAIGISTLTWLYIEEPGIRLGRRIIRYIQGRPGPQGKDPSLLVPVRAVTGTGNSPDAQF